MIRRRLLWRRRRTGRRRSRRERALNRSARSKSSRHSRVLLTRCDARHRGEQVAQLGQHDRSAGVRPLVAEAQPGRRGSLRLGDRPDSCDRCHHNLQCRPANLPARLAYCAHHLRSCKTWCFREHKSNLSTFVVMCYAHTDVGDRRPPTGADRRFRTPSTALEETRRSSIKKSRAEERQISHLDSYSESHLQGWVQRKGANVKPDRTGS